MNYQDWINEEKEAHMGTPIITVEGNDAGHLHEMIMQGATGSEMVEYLLGRGYPDYAANVIVNGAVESAMVDGYGHISSYQ